MLNTFSSLAMLFGSRHLRAGVLATILTTLLFQILFYAVRLVALAIAGLVRFVWDLIVPRLRPSTRVDF